MTSGSPLKNFFFWGVGGEWIGINRNIDPLHKQGRPEDGIIFLETQFQSELNLNLSRKFSTVISNNKLSLSFSSDHVNSERSFCFAHLPWSLIAKNKLKTRQSDLLPWPLLLKCLSCWRIVLLVISCRMEFTWNFLDVEIPTVFRWTTMNFIQHFETYKNTSPLI